MISLIQSSRISMSRQWLTARTGRGALRGQAPLLVVALGLCGGPLLAGEVRVGIIGCDTSHVIAFTELLNDPQAKEHVPGAKVVAAYAGGSPDIPSSRSRLHDYTNTLATKYGVKFSERIENLCDQVDAVLLESVDGRPHLSQARPVLKAGKRLFIDKPMAGSLGEVMEIFRLAKAAKVPVFSSSALRFGKTTQFAHQGGLGRITYAETYGSCELEPHHPDLFWYGVHGVEALYAVLGRGCETVQRGTTADGKIEVIGNWSGGRKGIFREDQSFHGLAKGDKSLAPVGSFDGYAPLVGQIVKFFQTGVEPVDPAETIEIFAFMEAADESKRQGGAAIKLADVFARTGAKPTGRPEVPSGP